MKLWLNQGYLPDDLEVRTASEANFSQLRYRKHEIDSSFEQEFPPSASAASPSQPPNAPPAASQGGEPGGSAPTVPDASVYPGMNGQQVGCCVVFVVCWLCCWLLFVVCCLLIVGC